MWAVAKTITGWLYCMSSIFISECKLQLLEIWFPFETIDRAKLVAKLPKFAIHQGELEWLLS